MVLCLVEWSCPMSEVAEMAQGKDANFGKITGRLRASLYPWRVDYPYVHTTQHNSVRRPAPQLGRRLGIEGRDDGARLRQDAQRALHFSLSTRRLSCVF